MPEPIIVGAVRDKDLVSLTWLPVPGATNYSIKCDAGLEVITSELAAGVPCADASGDRPLLVGVRALGPTGESAITWAVVVSQ